MIMIILSGNYPRHYNAIMLELTDFDDNKISYLARISRGQTTIRRDTSNWNPYDSGTFIPSASK